MVSTSWSRWLRSLFRSRTQTYRKPVRSRLRLHQLEDRLAPSTFMWMGFGPDSNWSDGANWAGGVAPTGSATSLDDLVFSSGAKQLTNVNDLTGAVFNSITIAGSNFTLGGNALTLGSPSVLGSGHLIVNSGATGNTMSMPLTLGGPAGGQQSFTVNSGANLTISSGLSGTSGVALSKDGAGTLDLTADNSGFTGAITITQGIVEITNANGLGDTTNGTTIQQNAQLQLAATVGTVNENLITNGSGPDGSGALVSLGGKINTWAGTIQMDSNTTFGVKAGTFDITGQISDLGSGRNLTKEGAGKLIFASANTYRGETVINNGVLDIQNGQALGTADGSFSSGTVVNSSITETGTLQIEDPTGVGFVVSNELLTLNGFGSLNGSIGAVDNVNGSNTWTGNVVLGSPAPNGTSVTMKTEANTSLTVSGIVSDPNGEFVNGSGFELTKTGNGILVFVRANTYLGKTDIQAGILDIRDSKGLGATDAGATVERTATLELEVDALPDSVTGTTNTLVVAVPLQITGNGFQNQGALRSASGINLYTGSIKLVDPVGSIAVDADPNPTGSSNYFPTYSPTTGYALTGDYSLTVTGDISGAGSTTFEKDGAGQLIIPHDNPRFDGPVQITAGWVTIQTNEGLGSTIPAETQNLQPTVTIATGAALHLDPAAGNLTISQNFILSGTGFAHPYGLINQMGAIENIAGINKIVGNIILRQQVGVGVERVPPPGSNNGRLSQLTLTGPVSERLPLINVNATASGGETEDDNIIDTGSTSGTITINYDMYSIPDSLDVFHGVNGSGGTRIYTSGGPVSGSATVVIPYGPPTDSNTSTKVEIIINLGGGITGTAWTYTATINPNGVQHGGIIKLGSQLLIVQGPGTYDGANEIKQGVLLDQNNTGLGSGAGSTTVDSGAALALGTTLPWNNGGIVTGLQVWGEQLILNGMGNNTVTSGQVPNLHLAPLTILQDDSIAAAGTTSIVPADYEWRGPVTLNTSVPLDITPQSRLNILGPIDDATNTATAGSDLIKLNTGELVLSGLNTYRGVTYVGANTDPDGVVEAYSGSPNASDASAGGVVTVANSQALGAGDGTAATGTVVDSGSALQLEGNITVAGERLTIKGTGIPVGNTQPTQSWFAQGPEPITNGQTTGLTAPVTGRITGVTVDATDPKTIYISTSDGGAWKTSNDGQTWQPLFDVPTNAPIFAGAIAVVPDDPNTVYLATGEANNTSDSFAGNGVYKSTDAGRTWTLLTNTGGSNPVAGTAISKLVIDPTNESRIYIATSDEAVGSTTGRAGIWRYDSRGWVNLTANTSNLRRLGSSILTNPTPTGFPDQQNPPVPPPNTPGPDDNWNLSFPSSGAYSDVLWLEGTLYMALGSPQGDVNNAVYYCSNPTADEAGGQIIWDLGDANAANKYDSGGGSAFPVATPPTPRNATIRLDGVPVVGGPPTLYAAITQPGSQALLELRQSVDGGITWKQITAPNYLGNQGNYDSAILVVDPATVLVAGQNQVLLTTNSGGAWAALPTDTNGNGPHDNFHSLQLDSQGRLLVGSDGGVWRYDPTDGSWTDLNGSLFAITQLSGVGIVPGNPTSLYATSVNSGTVQFSNQQGWSAVDNAAGIDPTGSKIFVDPNNPSTIYAQTNSGLRKSTDGGKTWRTITGVSPVVMDSVNTQRLVAGSVEESLDGGNTWRFLGSPLPVTEIGLAAYQGTYAFDPAFPLVPDVGANTYTPGTIYVASGSAVAVTKNYGTTWVNRDLPFAGAQISALVADPRNRDTVYAALSTPDSVGHTIYMSTNAGQTWTDLTGLGSSGLVNQPVWALLLDPRNGTLYVGTNTGVYTSTGNAQWSHVGVGLPNVQVRDLQLDQSNNVLTAATYGRGAFQIWLNTTQANAGAGLGALSGSAVWTGPIVLTGDTTIRAAGAQVPRNGVATATLNILGTISDAAGTTGPNYNRLTKVGLGDVILSSPNTYSGITEVKQGGLIIRDPQALGATTNGTVVDANAALELQSSVNGEPLTLNGDGLQPPFNGHQTGALESVSNTNAYSGPITLATNSTIGVDSGSMLTVTGAIGDGGNNLNLTKELTGLLVLAGADTYGGVTYVNQGALQIQNSQALGVGDGTAATGTVVLDGAQLQLQAPTSGQPVVVAGEYLSLTGTGIFGTGALLDSGGNNAWNGPVQLDHNPAFSPISDPVGVVSFGVQNASDALSIGGRISDTLPTGVVKVGPGMVVLSNNGNSYRGSTYINNGTVRVQSSNALGASATPGVQRITLSAATGTVGGTFVLSFNGQNSSPIAFNAPASTVQSAVNGLLPAGGSATVVANTSTVAGNTVTVYTVTFGGTLAGVDVAPLAIATSTSVTGVVSVVADGGIGTLVSPGTALQFDGDPTNVGASINVPEQITLNGSGLTTNGALENLSGNNTASGPINLATSSTIGVDTGTSLTSTADVSGPALSVLTKLGTGTLFLTAANDYQGTTQIQQGILNISNALALGGPVTNETQQLTLSGAATGSYTLTFNGAMTGVIPYTATALAVQTALNGLPTIGGVNGSVSVTQNGPVYTVVFGGTLAGQDLTPGLSAVATPGTGAAIATLVVGGRGGTVVSNGTTLQIQGNTTVSTEQLILTGNGFNGIGALDSVSGNNGWNSPLILAGGVTISADGSSTLAIDSAGSSQVISEATPGSTLTKIGTGTVVLSGTNSNTYSGLTTVDNGTLKLNKTAGANAIPASLNVGDGAGAANSTVVQLLASNQIADSATVTVASDGRFDVNNQTETIGPLVIMDGTATTGTGSTGSLTVAGLSMTGGTLSTGTAGSTVILAGNVTATSDANGSAVINGAGTLSLGGSTRDFTINPGGQAIDLDVNAVVVGTGSEGLTKDGTGTLKLDQVNTYTGPTTIDAGDVQVDGAIGAVALNGGTLSGTGHVGAVTGTSSSSAIGTVAPGDNTTSTPYGILTSQGETWGTQTTYSVDLDRAGSGAGTGYDQLDVSGTINLGGATLTGSATSNVQIGQSFTIIQTTGGTVQSRFAEPFGEQAGTSEGIVFIGGDKFLVDYSNPTKVVLHRVKIDAVIGVTSSDNPAAYGEDVVFTIAVTPEPGGTTPLANNDTVTLTLDGNSAGAQTLFLNGSNQLTVDYSQLTGGSFLSVGQHSLVVAFSGDANYNPSNNAASPFTQTVNAASTTLSVTSNPINPVFGQTTTLIATIGVVAPGGGIPDSGTVTFTVDGVAQTPVAVSSGQATLNLSNLTATTHHVSASFSGYTNYVGSATTQDYLLTVSKDAVAIGFGATPSEPAYGQPVTLAATVAAQPPGTGQPTGTVTFWDGAVGSGTRLGAINLTSGEADLSLPTLQAGTRTINVAYSGDNNFATTTTSFTLLVDQASTSTSITTSGTPMAAGRPVTFTATVINQSSVNINGTPVPTGTVDFLVDGTVKGMVTLNSLGVAVFTTTALTPGTHTITATYVGTSNFATSSDALSQMTTGPSLTTVTASPSSSVVDQSVTFTATIRPNGAGGATPTGSVIFSIDGVDQLPAVPVDSTGKAALAVDNLGVGGHVIGARYSGDTVYSPSANTLNFTVNKISTSTTFVTPVTSAVYGQALSYTVTVASIAPGTGTPVGSVFFVVDRVIRATVSLDNNGQANFNPGLLGIGSHTIAVGYSGSADFNTSVSSVVTLTISKAQTQTTLNGSTGTAAFGQPVTYTATVQTLAPSTTTPVGSVGFMIDGILRATGTVNSSGQAIVNLNGIPLGTHSITAAYLGTANLGSSNSSGVPVTISATDTTTTVSASHNPAVIGQPLTFTATVNAVLPSIATITLGQVRFTLDGVVKTTVNIVNGAASFSVSGLTAGPHIVKADYLGEAHFNASSGTLTESIVHPSLTTLSASPATTMYHQFVTFTATVKSGDTLTATPTGAVTFAVDGVNQLPAVLLDGTGQATLSINTINAGTHVITAVYGGDNNYNVSVGSMRYTVTQIRTTTVFSTPAISAVFGQPVTYSATVLPVSPGTDTPVGSVAFLVDGVIKATAPLDNTGTASAALNYVHLGTHQVTAEFLGSTNFAASVASTSANLTVTPANTTTTVTTPQNPSMVGQPVVFTATVLPASPSLAQPTSGTVTFYVDGVATITANLTAAGTARYITSSLPVGNHTITARFAGNPNVYGSTSPALLQTVAQPGTAQTAVTLTSSANPALVGETVTYTTKVSAVNSALGTPSGWVMYVVDAVYVGYVPLDSTGQSTFSTSFATTGNHRVTIIYYGDATFAPSVAPTSLVQQITGTTTATSLLPTVTANSDGSFTITAEAVNAAGNLVMGFSGLGSLTVLSSPAGGVLSGPTSANFSNGIAVFANLMASKAGTYVVQIAVGNLSVEVSILTGGRQT